MTTKEREEKEAESEAEEYFITITIAFSFYSLLAMFLLHPPTHRCHCSSLSLLPLSLSPLLRGILSSTCFPSLNLLGAVELLMIVIGKASKKNSSLLSRSRTVFPVLLLLLLLLSFFVPFYGFVLLLVMDGRK